MSDFVRARSRRGAALVATAACSALLAATVASPASAGPTAYPSPDARLAKALQHFVSSAGGSPGIIVTILDHGRIRIRSAGVADVVSGRKPQGNDFMRLASVAKAFSGATALSLVAGKELALTDTIGQRLKGFPPGWSKVTLAQLLGHTSGISDFSANPAFIDALVASLQKAPPPRVLLSYASPRTLFTPGSKYHYSNSDNILTALMVEAATGRRYEAVLQDRVLVPLQLAQTSLPSGSAIGSPTFRGYQLAPPKAPEDVTTLFAAGWTWASGGVVSTPVDAVRFVAGYVRGATTNAVTRAAQFTFRPGSSEPPGPGINSAGLALFRYQTSCGTVYGHTGNTAGYTQFVASTRDGSRAVVVSVNAQITPKTNAVRFADLRHIDELAVCAAGSAR